MVGIVVQKHLQNHRSPTPCYKGCDKRIEMGGDSIILTGFLLSTVAMNLTTTTTEMTSMTGKQIERSK